MKSRPGTYDDVILEIAAYACQDDFVASDEARSNALLCLMDAVGCALRAVSVSECRSVMEWSQFGGVEVSGGARVPGLRGRMPVAQAAGATTAAIRWLDFNDTWLAQEWGHPSDNIGAVLAVADALASRSQSANRFKVSGILDWLIKAYEVQGVLALDNAFNRVGIDHVLLVKVASAAVVAAMFSDRDIDVVRSAASHAWLDATLRTYRHGENTGSRKSWAAGDAVERAVKLAVLSNDGQQGCRGALTAPGWGFEDVWFGDNSVKLRRPLGCYVIENVLFKVRYPAEFHGQTAIEAAIDLHEDVVDRLDDVAEVRIETQESAMRIINKDGELRNEADRDHCIQYMVAVALLRGDLKSEDYEEEAAGDTRIDDLRSKMTVRENPEYSRDYLAPESRSIANSVQVIFQDGTQTDAVEVMYPLGHRRRRYEARPWLVRKFVENVRHSFGDSPYAARVIDAFSDMDMLLEMDIDEFMAMLQTEG